MPEFKLPDVGEGLTEAEIVTWKVKVGDVVAINDIVVEIETAKSLVELPSPYAGTVHGAAGARGRDRRRSARRSSRSATARRPRRPRRSARGDAAADLARSTCPTRPPAAAARARAWSAATRPTAARCAGPRKGVARVRRRRAPTQSSCRRRSRPAAGRRRRSSRPTSRPCRRRARSRRPSRREPTATCARWPSRRCASWPRTSASTSPRSSATGPNGTVTREDVEAASGVRAASSTRPLARPRRTTPRPASARRREPIKGVRKMMGQAMVRLGLHRPARHRVGHRRRRPARWSSSSGSRPAASSATSRSRRCWCWPGR